MVTGLNFYGSSQTNSDGIALKGCCLRSETTYDMRRGQEIKQPILQLVVSKVMAQPNGDCQVKLI